MKALLLGNGINNITTQYSWSDLLQDLIQFVGLKEKPNMEGKPFPLLYEEIFMNAARQNQVKEKQLKKFLAERTRQMQPNEVHEAIATLKLKTLLTTNYDSTLEKALGHSTFQNEGIIKENLYSLYRVHHCSTASVWHVHGSLINPASITLGYEHYSGYLQQMRSYTVSQNRKIISNAQSLLNRLKDKSVMHTSWVDFFFTHDIHIIGLNLDFVEIHLWWLITFRARIKLNRKIPIRNTINYYYPASYTNRFKNKLELLQANEVNTIAVESNTRKRVDFYKKVLKRIEN